MSLEADKKLLAKLLAMMVDKAASPAEREFAKMQSRKVRARINEALEQSDEDMVARSTHDRIWVTRDEETISVDAMEDGHVVAAYRFLKQWAVSEKRPVVKDDIKRWAKLFKSEINKRKIDLAKRAA